MYELVCEAHFIMKRLNYKQFEWDQEKRIFNYFGVPLSREPSTDSVLNQFKNVFIDYKYLAGNLCDHSNTTRILENRSTSTKIA